MSDEIKTKLITTMDEFQELVPLFFEGYEAIEEKPHLPMEWPAFLKTLMRCVSTAGTAGGIIVAYDMDDNPIGYGVAHDNTPMFQEQRYLLLYCLYSKYEKRGVVPKVLLAACEELAKQQGYTQLQCFSSRFAGSAIHFYTDKLFFHKAAIYYTKDLI